MRAVIQRVSSASVAVDGECIASIGRGLLVLLGLERPDDLASGRRMLDRLLAYRVFSDDQGRMNRSVVDIGGGVLLISQFTLAADTRKGRRPGFSAALPPEEAAALYQHLLAELRERHPLVGAGEFGADMQVSLVNDGPVTFVLES